ncbi:DNA-3-methyladenine glycosylase [Bacteroidota bacterium]
MRISNRDFFTRDVLEVAPNLIGCFLVRKFKDGREIRHLIAETEAYRGEEDMACHASKGRTNRTEIMYHMGGILYVYFIYGMYWMLNIVTERAGIPQAVLIRGINEMNGPGKLTGKLKIDKSFYGEDLIYSNRIWIEMKTDQHEINLTTRIGLKNVDAFWKNKQWRYVLAGS